MAARNGIPLATLTNGMFEDQNCEALLVDYGFRGAENYTPEELRGMLKPRIELLMRLETFAQDLILQHRTFSDFIDAFVAGVEGARASDRGDGTQAQRGFCPQA